MTQRVIAQSGASVLVPSASDVPVAATTTTAGIVKKGAAVTDCTVAADGTSAGTQLNALLASLRAAGII